MKCFSFEVIIVNNNQETTQKMFEAATNRAPAEYWIWDGIHPTYAGHQLIADEWVRSVRNFWPEKN